MKITMVGAGYVGLVSGACFSEFGHTVVCVDSNADKIAALNAGKMPIFEPGLEALVAANCDGGRLSFSVDLGTAVAQSEVVFIAVGTPSRRGDGYADLGYVYAAAEEIAGSLQDGALVVTKSTVPVGTGSEIARVITARLETLGRNIKFDVASNPEFLREGSAIRDFQHPDRVVAGAESQEAHDTIARLYKPLSLRNVPMVQTSRETAELIKYAGNAFLATKITFINEIADLCENVGANVQEVARGIGLDGRIGGKFLHAGPGYGGSCFPKDTRALLGIAEQAEVTLPIVEAVTRSNDQRKARMADRVVDACGGSVEGKTIAVLGLTFKPNTDDMRESPSLDIIPALQEAGASVQAYDPEGMPEASKLLSGVVMGEGIYDTMEGADALLIITEWNAFRALDLARVKSLLKTPVVVDLRNIYVPEDMQAAGFNYHSIGRGTPS
jgi:UDPglucose 6-dehydrogenase